MLVGARFQAEKRLSPDPEPAAALVACGFRGHSHRTLAAFRASGSHGPQAALQPQGSRLSPEKPGQWLPRGRWVTPGGSPA